MDGHNSSNPEFLSKALFADCPYEVLIFTVVYGVSIFPLYFLVLNIGFQRWRQNKHSTVSHSDSFTFHIFLFELLLFCGFCVIALGNLHHKRPLVDCGMSLLVFTTPGLLSLHVLTCIERYLAVVFPVVYLSLKKQQWIQARSFIIIFNLIICGLWLCVVRAAGEMNLPVLLLMGSVTGVVSFFSVQALRALTNPRPGEGRGVSESKRKAFFTMLTILSCLLLWFSGGILVHGVLKVTHWDPGVLCKLTLPGCLLQIPSSLVLPLLFLHRAGKLPQCPGKKGKNPGVELN